MEHEERLVAVVANEFIQELDIDQMRFKLSTRCGPEDRALGRWMETSMLAVGCWPNTMMFSTY